METYEVIIMAQKAGRKPVRLGYYEAVATSEQEALDIATDAGNDHYEHVCASLGHHRDETTRIWAELANRESEDD